MKNKPFKFIDLCAGIGGFHQALSAFGGDCVFAAEIDPFAIETYYENYQMDANHDITNLSYETLPTYDVLCAGFPCQSFSKAGGQAGFTDTRGTLFFNIAQIIKATQPKYILLENVRNLASHDHGNTWRIIRQSLDDLGYHVPLKPFILSPIEFGVPQSRDRVVIPCVRKDIEDGPYELSIPKRQKTSVYDILEADVPDKYFISDYEKMVLNVWDTFIKGVKEEIIGFPIWFDYLNEDDLKSLGFPGWKMQFVQKNQNLYKNNKAFIDQWRLDFDAELSQFKPTDRKFEWQMGKGYKSIYEGIIQFRPSGVRVKKPDFLPALVAMVHTPIIGRDLRRIKPKECAKLQSFPDEFILSRNEKQAYKQFGNAVNVEVIKYVFEHTVLNSIDKT